MVHNSVSIFGTKKISKQADDRSNHQGMGERGTKGCRPDAELPNMSFVSVVASQSFI